MRPYILLPVFAMLCAVPAQAHEFSLSVGSQLLDVEDTDSFNIPLSDDPFAHANAIIELGGGVYAELDIYSGFQDPLNDESSEIDFEGGWEGDIAEGTVLNIAAGRWSNYQGGGFESGDWFGRVTIMRAGLTASAGIAVGESDTGFARIAYDLRLAKRLTFTPSVAYLTNGSEVNPGVLCSYELSSSWSLAAGAVYAKNENGDRKADLMLVLTANF